MFEFPFAQQLWAAANVARCSFLLLVCAKKCHWNDFAMKKIIWRQADDVSLRWTMGWILHAFKTKNGFS